MYLSFKDLKITNKIIFKLTSCIRTAEILTTKWNETNNSFIDFDNILYIFEYFN